MTENVYNDPDRFIFLGVALACVAYFVVTYALREWRHMVTMNDFVPVLLKRTITISYVYDSVKRIGVWQACRAQLMNGEAGIGDTEHNALVALIAIEALKAIEELKAAKDLPEPARYPTTIMYALSCGPYFKR